MAKSDSVCDGMKGSIDESVFIADGARLAGDNIKIGRESSVWFNTPPP